MNVGGKLLTNYLKELVSYRWAELAALGPDVITLNYVGVQACAVGNKFISSCALLPRCPPFRHMLRITVDFDAQKLMRLSGHTS